MGRSKMEVSEFSGVCSVHLAPSAGIAGVAAPNLKILSDGATNFAIE
jgi:hypothetical protein